jgi:hypothetical protein
MPPIGEVGPVAVNTKGTNYGRVPGKTDDPPPDPDGYGMPAWHDDQKHETHYPPHHDPGNPNEPDGNLPREVPLEIVPDRGPASSPD